VLTLQKNRETGIVSVQTSDRDIEELLNKEWLLTNSRGGYAASTIIGCNTRRYHGLLIGSLNPPVNRIMALSQCMEMIISKKGVHRLSTFDFGEKFSPEGYINIRGFRQDTGVHFDYLLDDIELTKSLYLMRQSDTVAIVYDFKKIKESAELTLRPFVGLRDFHILQKSYATMCMRRIGTGLLVRHETPNSSELFMNCPNSSFEKDPQWWFNFHYRKEQERGQDFTEDLWSPGFFKAHIDSPGRIILWADFSSKCNTELLKNADIDSLREDLVKHQNNIMATSNTKNHRINTLYLASDAFVTKKDTDQGMKTTIVAGYPWFADWGRDTFISMPGLLLCTARYEHAKNVLTTFAQIADRGMIPNRFDDYTNSPCINSIDASLWFINSSFEYLKCTSDFETFERDLMPTIRWIIESYYQGTHFDIHADEDSLITGGNPETQLTWMDAKFCGVAFTPRYGKAVEINALWYNCLCLMAEFYTQRDSEAAEHFHNLSEKVKNSFQQLFWNEQAGYLNDCVLPGGSVDASCRPNQIVAVALTFSPLNEDQQKKVVDTVERELLTPFGLRTLSPQESRYKGIYTGPQGQRDEAYHQGTVWPYLLGGFITAYLRVNDYSPQAKLKAEEFIEPLLKHLTEDGCLGQISEIFDGNSPHTHRGCIAQAWSVAELIRAFHAINNGR
jgi:predicted glycogen debranching enzyme